MSKNFLSTRGEGSGEDLHSLVEVSVLEHLDPGDEDVEAGDVGDGLAKVGQLRKIRKLKWQLKQSLNFALDREEHVDIQQNLAH
jgi:hypothetical protein